MICSRLHCCCNVSICVRAVRPPGHLRRHHPHQSLFACNRRTAGLSYFKPAIPMRPADRTPHPDGFTSFIPTDFNVAASTHLALVHVSTFHLALVHLSSYPCPPFLLPLSTFHLVLPPFFLPLPLFITSSTPLHLAVACHSFPSMAMRQSFHHHSSLDENDN